MSFYMLLSFPPQRHNNNLCRGTKPERDEATETYGHIQGPVALAVHSAPLVVDKRCGRPTEYGELHGMGMPAERELCSGTGKYGAAP